MKILRIIDRLNVGGPAIHVTLLSQPKNATDTLSPWETHLVYGQEGPAEGSMAFLAKKPEISVSYIPSLGRELHPLRDLVTFAQLIALIRKYKPDVVHTHKSKAGAVGRLAAWLCGVPVIVHTYHGHVLHGYFGRLKSKLFISIERLLACLSGCVIAVSPKVKADLVQYHIAPENKVRVCYLGLDLKRFLDQPRNPGHLRRELGLSSDTPLVGIVARLVPIKGIPIFLKACQDVAEAVPSAHFIIVGDGELRPALEAQAGTMPMAKQTHFLGFRDDLESIYADFDVLSLTSYNEGSPVSLIEGLAAGCAVAAVEVGGVSDVVREGITGLLVSRNAITDEQISKKLADVIVDLLKDRDKRRRFGEAGRMDVSARFAVQRLVRDLDAIYQELLHRKYPIISRVS